MVKWSVLCLFFRIVPISDGAAMHEQNRMVSIFSRWRGGQAINIFRTGGFQNLFIGECRSMMTLIGNDQAVIFYAFLDFSLSDLTIASLQYR